MKKCTACNLEKDFFLFKKSSRNKSGIGSICKICHNKKNREDPFRKARYLKRRLTSIKKDRERSKKWDLLNKKKMSEYKKQWKKNNPDKVKANHKRYKTKNKETLRIKNSLNEKYLKYIKKYRIEHKKERQERHLKRMLTDPSYKISCNLRNRLRIAVKKNYKSGSAVRDLGCSIQEFKKYLESKFQEGMSWDNYGKGIGKWNIDHIYPLSKTDLTNKKELERVCHYTNLQPLWFEENMKKGNKLL